MLEKAAKILRRKLKLHENSFDGKFYQNCQENSVPTSLLIFESLLLEGQICSYDDNSFSQATLTVSQMTMFNFKRLENTLFCLITMFR